MAGEPTVYRVPRKVITPKPISPRDAEKWKKHRIARGQDPSLPKLKK